MKRIILILIVASTMLTGCAHTTRGKDEASVDSLELQNVEETGLNDPLETRVELKSDEESNRDFWGTGSRYFFRGFIDKKTFEPSYQIYVTTISFSWMYFNNARYALGNVIKDNPIVSVGSDVQCSSRVCHYTEANILHLDRPTLESWNKEDIKLRMLSSKVSGHVDVEVNKDKTEEFISAMDQTIAFMKRQNASKTTQKITPAQ